jgi:4-carboxymuconolactone decarboxylase
MRRKTQIEGLDLREEIFGVESTKAAAPKEMQDFQRLGIEYTFGRLWSRPNLDRRSRSLITLALLTATRMTGRELKNHVRGALRNGCTPEEIRETFIHATAYCGFGICGEALTAANAILAENSTSS